jgi:hypothetical protein
MKNYYQLIPEKILKELPVISEILRTEIKGFSEDYLKEVISIVACHVRKDDGDTPLRNEYLRRLVPYAEKYLSGLIDLQIVKRSSYYIPKEISYRYTFTPEYQSKYVALTLKNPKLIYRISRAQSEIGKEAVKTIRGCSPQVRYLKQLSLAEGWEAVVESFKNDTKQYNSILASAMRIVNNDIFYSRDATERRFHSNVTNMKRELRPYLRVNGKPLTNIDVSNSQPYLSIIILTYPKKVADMTKNIAFAMLLQSLKTSVYKDDMKKYISLVICGNFYEYLMRKFSKEKLILTRDETKTQVLRILFAPNRMPKDETNRRCRMIFKKSFPTVHRIFSKVRGRDQGTRFENSNRFAILLATIESYLMIDVVLRRIYRELPGVVAITIHDSILTGILTDDVEAVRRIMSDELTKFVGFLPQIKIEDYLGEKSEEKKSLIQYDVTMPVSCN